MWGLGNIVAAYQACLGGIQLPSHGDSLFLVTSGVLPLAALPSPGLKKHLTGWWC